MQRRQNTFLNKISRLEKIFPSRGAAVAASFGGALLVSSSFALIPNTVGLASMKYLIRAKRDDTEVGPPPEARSWIQSVMLDLKLDKLGNTPLQICATPYELIESFGSFDTSYGVLLGLPSYLNADSPSEVVLDKPLKRHPGLQDKVQLLKEYHVLSDSSKKYCVYEGLYFASESKSWLSTFAAGFVCFLGTSGLSSIVCRHRRLAPEPIIAKIPVFLISCVAGLACGICAVEILKTNQFEAMVRNLPEKYVDGGIEFYSSVVDRCELRREVCVMDLFSRVENGFNENMARERLELLNRRKMELSA